MGDLELRSVGDGLPFALIRDEAGRPVAWERADERHPVHTVGSGESVRDVLSELLLSPLALGAVIDGEGRVQGVLDVELIHQLLERESVERRPA